MAVLDKKPYDKTFLGIEHMFYCGACSSTASIQTCHLQKVSFLGCFRFQDPIRQYVCFIFVLLQETWLLNFLSLDIALLLSSNISLLRMKTECRFHQGHLIMK